MNMQLQEGKNVVLISMGTPVIDQIAKEETEKQREAIKKFTDWLVKEKQYEPGKKQYPDTETYKELLEKAAEFGVEFDLKEGGTAANKLVATHNYLKGLGAKVESFLIATTVKATNRPLLEDGEVPTEHKGAFIKQGLDQAGITAFPEPQDNVDMAESINVMREVEDGSKRQKMAMIEYGSTKETLTSDNVKAAFEAAEQKAEETGAEKVAFMEMSLMRKLGQDTYKTYIKEAKERGFKVVMSLETSAGAFKENQDAYMNMLKQADEIRGNDDEILTFFPPENANGTREEQLRDSFRKLSGFMAKDLKNNEATAFITLGADGSAVITKNSYQATTAIANQTIRSTTGAGDAATGRFDAGRIMGESEKDAAKAANLAGLTVA